MVDHVSMSGPHTRAAKWVTGVPANLQATGGGAPTAGQSPRISSDSAADSRWLESFSSTRRRLARGEVLHRAGFPLESIYLIRSGWFKVELLLPNGRNQIVAFPLSGDLVGLDAICSARHATSSTALEDGETLVVPFRRLAESMYSDREIAQRFSRLMSSHLARGQSTMLLLGQMPAEQRVAAFLLELSARLGGLGHCCTSFTLRMTREEMGCYLGLQLETVSRILTRLRRAGLIEFRPNREVLLYDKAALQRIVEGLADRVEMQRTSVGAVACVTIAQASKRPWSV